MSLFPNSLLIIGAGKMGTALCEAWIKSGMNQDSLIVIDHNNNRKIEDVNIIPESIVLAVKPNDMNDLLPIVAAKFGNIPLYISIAAGKKISFFEKYLGEAAIVRAMPNTPAQIGKGISALFANNFVSEA
ncbi:MAG: NAD(P)-binding domain-containing protein, partial [Pseudomonadota bacterium]